MTRKKSDRELKRVVERVLPLVPTDHKILKTEFEVILGEIQACVHEKTGATMEQLEQMKAQVLADMPNEYGRLKERDRSWPALIAYLYSKHLRLFSKA